MSVLEIRRPRVPKADDDRYRWWVLAVTSLGALLSSLDRRHADHRAARHPARPAHRPVRAALDRRRLHARRDRPRPERGTPGRHGGARPHVHGRVRDLHARVGPVWPCPRRPDSHRGAHRPGHRRRAAHGQLGRARDRRVPASRAGSSARHQRHGHRRRADPGADPGRSPDNLRLAHRVLVQPADRARGHARGLVRAVRAGDAQTGVARSTWRARPCTSSGCWGS